MNQYKVLRFMELFWLCIASGMGLLSAWFISQSDWDQALIPILGTFFGAVLYALRRHQRRKVQYGNNPPVKQKNIKK